MKETPNTSSEVERIRQLLNTAAPSELGGSQRADAVLRRSRRDRTRSGALGALAVAVAAAAVVVGPNVVNSQLNDSLTGPGATGAVSPNDPLMRSGLHPYADPCPAAAIKVPPTTGASIELRPNDVNVRLCRASGVGVTSPWDPPADALVSELDGFIARVAQLPKADPDPCPTARVAPQPFALQVTDSEGDTRTLSSLMTTCGTVTVNSTRVAADGLLEAFRQALEDQRAVLQPELDDTTMQCRGTSPHVRTGWMSTVDAHTRFVAAMTCTGYPGGSDEPRPTSASDAAVELLNQEWAANARDLRTHKPLHVDECPTADVMPVPTYAMTTWGDVVRLQMVLCGDYRVGHFQLPMSEQLLDALSLPRQS